MNHLHTYAQIRLACRQRGMGAIAAIIVVVMLSSLAAAVTRLTYTQQISFAQDVLGAQAFQAANAGTEWGMYQALKGSWIDSACTGSSTLNLTSTMGFKVTVTCTSQTTAFNEGQDSSSNNVPVRLYIIDAVACNGSTAACPDDNSAAKPSYVERRRQAVISKTDNGL
jgi:MSHA biogenesis protein MshP